MLRFFIIQFKNAFLSGFLKSSVRGLGLQHEPFQIGKMWLNPFPEILYAECWRFSAHGEVQASLPIYFAIFESATHTLDDFKIRVIFRAKRTNHIWIRTVHVNFLIILLIRIGGVARKDSKSCIFSGRFENNC